MKQAIENTIESQTLKIITTWSLVVIGLCSIIAYAFFVNKAIFQAVEAGQFSSQGAQTVSRLNALQERFLSLQNSATLSRAHEVGLTEKEADRFLSRTPLGQGLSLHDEI